MGTDLNILLLKEKNSFLPTIWFDKNIQEHQKEELNKNKKWQNNLMS